MAAANEAYSKGDLEALHRINDDFQEERESRSHEASESELPRILRQITQARDRTAAIEREMVSLRDSELARLKTEVEAASALGRDLLAELAATVSEQIKISKQEHEFLEREASRRA